MLTGEVIGRMRHNDRLLSIANYAFDILSSGRTNITGNILTQMSLEQSASQNLKEGEGVWSSQVHYVEKLYDSIV